jgi:glycerophosphoryl diester phosphodiesterase
MHYWSRTAGPLLYAHRGANTELPENSIRAFRRALELGADVLELDLHPSRDGVFVVSHDPDGQRLYGMARPLADCDWAEIAHWDAGGERPARFEEVLDEFPGVALNVDVKLGSEREIRRLIALLRERDAESRVLLTSFSWGYLRRIRRSGYRGALGLSQLDVVRLRFSPDLTLKMLPLPGMRVQIPTRSGRIDLSQPEFIDRCHRLGLQVDYWVINEPSEATRLLNSGADGLFTDDVAAIAPVFRASSRCNAWRERHP